MSTLGERRIGIKFADTEKPADKLKIHAAIFINDCESLRDNRSSPDKHRLISLAQTSIEEASMWITKSKFTE